MRTVEVECRPIVTAPGGGSEGRCGRTFLTTPVIRPTTSASCSTGGRGGVAAAVGAGGAGRAGTGGRRAGTAGRGRGGTGGPGWRGWGGRCTGGGVTRCCDVDGRGGTTRATCSCCVVIWNV